MGSDKSRLPPHRLFQPTTAKWFAAVFGFALAYAVTRYHLVGDVPWRNAAPTAVALPVSALLCV